MPQEPKGAGWGLKNLFGRPTYLPKKKKKSGCPLATLPPLLFVAAVVSLLPLVRKRR